MQSIKVYGEISIEEAERLRLSFSDVFNQDMNIAIEQDANGTYLKFDGD